jgi:hypothetical protein
VRATGEVSAEEGEQQRKRSARALSGAACDGGCLEVVVVTDKRQPRGRVATDDDLFVGQHPCGPVPFRNGLTGARVPLSSTVRFDHRDDDEAGFLEVIGSRELG